MEFEADNNAFVASLQKVVGVIEKTQTIKVLGNVFIRTGEDSVYCTGSDSNVQLVSRCKARIAEAGAATVSGSKLHDISRYLSESDQITVHTSGNIMEIRSGKGFFSLKTLPIDQFPVLTMGTIQDEIVIDGGVFKNAIEKVAFCMGLQDVRRFLNGLYFSAKPGILEMIASDGHRLARGVVEIENARNSGKLFIPRKAVMELIRTIDIQEPAMKLRLSEKRIGADTIDMEYIAKLSEERFPDYNSVIPPSSDQIISAQKLELKEALVRVAVLSDDIAHGVLFKFEDDHLSLKSNNTEHEQGEEDLEINYSGEKVVVGFNARYVLEALQRIDSERVYIDINPQKHSMLMMGETEKNTKYLVMPIKI